MSRIGKQPVVLPEGVKVNLNANLVEVEGKLGKLSFELMDGISCNQENNVLHLSRRDDTREQKAYHGLCRALVHNMVVGVSEGYKKYLQVIGTGFSAEVVGPWLRLNVGYSHEILLEVPAGIKVEANSIPRGKGMHPEHQADVFISGIDKEAVGKFSAEVRSCREPENYKGKGIRYSTERVVIKAGKAGA